MEQYTNLIFLLLFTPFLFFFVFHRRKKKLLNNSQKNKINTRLKNEQLDWQKQLNDDINRVTPKQIEELIPTLGLSKNILTLFQGKCDDEVMKKHFFDKDYSIAYDVLHMTKKMQNAYLIDRYKPILAYADEKVFAYDTKLKGYNLYYLEDDMPNGEYCFTWDGLFIYEILFWLECEIPDNEILHIGNYFGLNHTKEVLKNIYKETNGKGFDTVELQTEWENKILDQINGIIK